MVVRLKVAEAFRNDVGRGIVRVDSKVMEDLKQARVEAQGAKLSAEKVTTQAGGALGPGQVIVTIPEWAVSAVADQAQFTGTLPTVWVQEQFENFLENNLSAVRPGPAPVGARCLDGISSAPSARKKRLTSSITVAIQNPYGLAVAVNGWRCCSPTGRTLSRSLRVSRRAISILTEKRLPSHPNSNCHAFKTKWVFSAWMTPISEQTRDGS